MKSASDNIPALYFYVESWITGTQDLTPQQRGIYIQLLSHAQVRNGRGLPNDIVKLSRLSLLCNPDDLTNWEEQKKDLYFILKSKFILKENDIGIESYFNERQQKEYEIARKKKDQVLQANKKYNNKRTKNNDIVTTSSDSDSDNDIFNNIWDKLTYKRGSKKVAEASFWKIPEDVKSETIIKKYNELCSTVDDPKFVPHFATWINQARWEEELPVKNENEYSGIQLRKDDDYKKWVSWVKRGRRHLSISDDMVLKMKNEGLITEEEYKAW